MIGRQNDPPAVLFSPNARSLGWQRVWQKPTEAASRCCFSIPPSFCAILIFKAIIGLSNKILSNQILSSNLVLRLPPLAGGSLAEQGQGRALSERSSSLFWAQAGRVASPPSPPSSSPTRTPAPRGSKEWGARDLTVTRDRPTHGGPGSVLGTSPIVCGWVLSPPCYPGNKNLPGCFFKGVVGGGRMNRKWLDRREGGQWSGLHPLLSQEDRTIKRSASSRPPSAAWLAEPV